MLSLNIYWLSESLSSDDTALSLGGAQIFSGGGGYCPRVRTHFRPSFYERVPRRSFPAVGGGQRSSTPPPRFPEDYHPVYGLACLKDGTSLRRGDPLLARQRGRPGLPRSRRGRCYRSQVRLCPVFNEASVQPRLATMTIRSAVETISPPNDLSNNPTNKGYTSTTPVPCQQGNYLSILTSALRSNPILFPGTRRVLLLLLPQ